MENAEAYCSDACQLAVDGMGAAIHVIPSESFGAHLARRLKSTNSVNITGDVVKCIDVSRVATVKNGKRFLTVGRLRCVACASSQAVSNLEGISAG